MKTVGKWLIRILIALLIAVFAVLSVFSLGERIMFFEFYKNSDVYTPIPDILSGYIPQGYCLVEGEDYRLGCGYTDGSTVEGLRNAQRSTAGLRGVHGRGRESLRGRGKRSL